MFLVGVGFLAGVFLFSPPSAHASECEAPFEYTPVSDSVFQNYESTEYINGHLVVHFKLTRYMFSFENWRPSFVYIDDQCRSFERGGYLKITNPENVPSLNLSLRFVSSSEFIFWNDDTNERFVCGACQGSILDVGDFFKVRFRMIAHDGPTKRGEILSSAHTTLENPSPPPTVSNTLPATPGCPVFSVSNGVTDDYERAEYVDGQLRIHFRRYFVGSADMKIQLTAYGPGCTNPQTRSYVFQYSPQSFIEYFSVRFPNDHDFQLWDDDSERIMDCNSPGITCSGPMNRVPEGGLVGVSILHNNTLPGAMHSTAFPIVEAPPVPPDPVIIIPGILGSWVKDGQLVIDPVLHTYDDLIETLDANGYTPDVDLFAFPYEWRNSNIISAQALRDKINDVQAICNCAKVDLVAHSMGGLVARQYIQSSDYENDVDQLIFLGTPHLGSPKAYLMWEGEQFGTTVEDNAVEFIFKREAKKNDYDRLIDYIHARVLSVQQLLPITDYIKDKDTGILRTFPQNYPQNDFLADLTAGTTAFLNSGVRISNFVGDLGSSSTITTIRVVPSLNLPLWEHGYPENFDDEDTDRGLEMGNGDETVTLSSANYINEDLSVLPSKHGKLPSDAEGLIYKKLTGKDATTLIHKDRGTNKKLLIIKILSPADIQVIAPDGKRIGKDFTTGQEINEIEDAFYSGFLTDDEYITILNPLDGEYKVQTQGTGTGEYTIATGFITETTLADQDFTANTVPGANNELEVTINNSQPEVIVVAPADTTPPEIAITSPLSQEYPRTSLTITATITDPSGVAQTLYFFDGVPASPSVDLFFQSLGAHTVTIQATDTVNNTASKSVSFNLIATFDSSISDTNRTFDLGWITSAKTRDTIISKFQSSAKNSRNRARTLNSLIDYLNRQLNKTLNQQAYDVLKEDIDWLLTH